MKRFLSIAFLLVVTASANADDLTRTITVSGSGTYPATPDRASLHMSIVVRDPSLVAVQERAAAVTAAVLALIDKHEINRSQVNTTGASVQPDYRYNRQSEEQEFRGYIAMRQMVVEFRDLEKLPLVVEGAVAAGVNQVSPPRLYSSKQKEAYRSALDNATKDARANAERLAESLGLELGEAVSVSTVPLSQRPSITPNAYVRAMSANVSDSETYNAGDQKVHASVTIVFELND